MNFEEFKYNHQKVQVDEFPNKVLGCLPNPVLSVLLITYQHVNYIHNTINGILIQKTDFPFEIIIGDDESTDGTREICIEYAKKYPEKIRLFLHKRENNIKILGNPCHIFQYTYNCFNLRGKYIAGVSGDDYWTDPTKLQKQHDFLRDNPEYSMCYHRFAIIRQNSNHISDNHFSVKTSNEKVLTSVRPLTTMYWNIFSNIPEQFVEVLAEDTFTNFILSTLGKFKFIENIDAAVYREHTGGVWSLMSRKFKHDESVLTATKILYAYRGTKYQKYCEINLLRRIIRRRKFLLKSENEGFIYSLHTLIKEVKEQNIPGSTFFYIPLTYLKEEISKKLNDHDKEIIKQLLKKLKLFY